jgi:uncharacterized membrane protein
MTNNPSARTFSSDFKRFFIRGLVVLLPSVLTLWIIVKAYQFVDNTIAEPINAGVRAVMVQVTWAPLRNAFDPTPEAIGKEKRLREDRGIVDPDVNKIRAELRAANIRQWWADRWYMNVIGLIVAVVAVYVAGRLLGGFFGRRISRKLESLITTLPVFKQVYPYVKQIVDFLFSDERPLTFNRVVVVEYPRKGVWSVGFLTGETMKTIREKAGDSVTVFIPSSPTPFTGYTITVARNEVIELPITVDQAIRFAVSGGVLVPEHQLVRPEEEEKPAGPPLPSGEEAATAQRRHRKEPQAAGPAGKQRRTDTP